MCGGAAAVMLCLVRHRCLAHTPANRVLHFGIMVGRQRFGSSLSSAVRGARRRVADVGWSMVLTPVAAGLAWYIAHTLLGHHDPFFAPTAAAVSLSKVRVLRAQRALQLGGLQQARSTALLVAGIAPRRWPERSRVRQVTEQIPPLDLLAATVLSLAHASTVVSAAQQPHSRALPEALGELRSACAATGGPNSRFIATLVQTCADETARLTGNTGSRVP